MKIAFFSFQGIRNGLPRGAVKAVFSLAEDLGLKKNVSLFLGYFDKANTHINIGCVSVYYRLAHKIIRFFSRIFRIPSYKQRYLSEILFDLFASLKIKEATIVISSSYLKRTLQKNKKLGGSNIFIAYNPYDIEINAILKKEKISHGVTFTDAYTYERRIEFIRYSMSLYDQIVTFTASEYESFIKQFSKNKISFVESFILPKKQAFPKIDFKKNSKLTFCYVAHPFWLKGIIHLLEAWSMINNSEIKLRIAGNVDQQLKNIIQERFFSLKNVEYTGWVDDLNQFLRTSHVCVVPSLLDAGPTTVAEAMCCNLPVVVSTGCGARTLIDDGVNGFIVEAGNSTVIAEKINWFIEHRNKIEKMGEEASNKIIKISGADNNKAVVSHLLKVIKKLQVK
ncbi:glycosyltransferase family 4 protein [Akkermansiaceae bacterium]|nr:glycosyltransferase family 4 protein [Akkermansiaceae bacterium]